MFVAVEHSQRMNPKVSARLEDISSNENQEAIQISHRGQTSFSSLAELHWKNQGGGWKKSSGREAGLTTPEYTQLKNSSTEKRGKTPE